MTSQAEWSLARRIMFRFAFVMGVLLVFPFPIGAIPWTDSLETALGKPLAWGTEWLSGVLGAPVPWPGPNGSGDRAYNYVQLLLVVLLAVLGATVWSVIDRRRRSYPRLAAGAAVVLRYYLAWTMLSYGVSKIMKVQFYDLAPSVLHQRVGQTPPMRLMWDFMGYSLPYTVFAGLAETAAGVLLLWRRTATLGALLAIAVLTNIVMMNLSYDVPVKRWSIQLLIMAVVIALPSARRLLGAVLGRAVPEVPPRPRTSKRGERARLIAKLTLIALLVLRLYLRFAGRPSHDDHRHELHGNWVVDSFVIDGVEHPPLTTDPVRWESWSANPDSMFIWLMDGTAEGRNTFERGWYGLKVDAAAHTMTVTVDYYKKTTETWKYARPTPDQLVIDCVHLGKSLHMTLHLEPEGVLMTRGFHWINEVPYNR